MKKIQIGVVSRSFSDQTHAETAKALREAGAVSTELCLHSADTHWWVYNGRSDMSGLTDDAFADIVRLYRDEGIAVTALGVFTNLIHPDANERHQNLAYFENHMRLAGQNGIPYVATECGFNEGVRGISADRYETDYQRLADSLQDLCQRAEAYDVRLALEPCVLDVVPSAKRAADLYKQLGTDRLCFLVDPANLIANSSERDMFQYLAPYVAYFHGKDRKVNDTYGRAVGDGDIDWPLFLRLYHEHCEGVPFILEYVNNDNFRAIMERVYAFDRLAQSEKTKGDVL